MSKSSNNLMPRFRRVALKALGEVLEFLRANAAGWTISCAIIRYFANNPSVDQMTPIVNPAILPLLAVLCLIGDRLMPRIWLAVQCELGIRQARKEHQPLQDYLVNDLKFLSLQLNLWPLFIVTLSGMLILGVTYAMVGARFIALCYFASVLMGEIYVLLNVILTIVWLIMMACGDSQVLIPTVRDNGFTEGRYDSEHSVIYQSVADTRKEIWHFLLKRH